MKLESLYFAAAILAPTFSGLYYFLSNRLYFVTRFHEPIEVLAFERFDHQLRQFDKEHVVDRTDLKRPVVFPITINNISRRDFDVFKITFRDDQGRVLQHLGLEKERYIDHGFIDFFDTNHVPYKLEINESAIVVIPGQRSIVINSLVDVPCDVEHISVEFSYINVGMFYAISHFFKPLAINKNISKQVHYSYPLKK